MRIVPLAVGLGTLAIVWLGPLSGGRHSFYAHMTVHMSVVAIAAPLLAISLAGGQWDPVRRKPSLFSPVVASFLELAVVWIWHTPTFHQAARGSAVALTAEQGTFLLSGFLLWIAVFGGDVQTRTARRATGIVALLLTVIHMTLLGALLALSPRPLYADFHPNAQLTPLEDQHLGGAIMLIVGGVSYLAGGLWLARGILRSQSQAEQSST